MLLAYAGGGYANRVGYDNYLAFNGQDGRVVWLGQGQNGVADRKARSNAAPPFAPGPTNIAPRIPTEAPGAKSSPGNSSTRSGVAATCPPHWTDALRTAHVIESAQRSVKTGCEQKVIYVDPAKKP